MNDETERTTKPMNELENDDLAADSADDIDVESALAAVASLHELTQEDDDAEDTTVPDTEDVESYERRRDEQVAETIVEDPVYLPDYPHPPVSTLKRGQIASVVPAILLIGVGVYLTVLLTTSQITLSTGLLIGGGIVIFGAALLAQWLSSGRWAAGNFFIGSSLLLTGAIAIYLIVADTLSLIDGWPLLLVAPGIAGVITDLLVPSGRRFWFVGLMLAVAGIAGTTITAGMLDTGLLEALAGLWPIAIVSVVILVIMPLLRRQV